MTRRRHTAGVVLGTVLVGLISTGCATVRGPQQTQTRTVSAVSAVELATSGELVLTGGSPASLRITAGENVLAHLTTDVRADRLTLGSDGTVHDVGPVRYDLTLPAARVVELSGSGVVRVSAPALCSRCSCPARGWSGSTGSGPRS
ncbi:MAG: GIN domain-containing protein [Blastococcus sp.]